MRDTESIVRNRSTLSPSHPVLSAQHPRGFRTRFASPRKMLVHKKRSPVSESSQLPRLGGKRLPRLNRNCDRQHHHRTARRHFFNGSGRTSNHRRRRPNSRRFRTNEHSPSLLQHFFWLADNTTLSFPWLEDKHTNPFRLLGPAGNPITLP